MSGTPSSPQTGSGCCLDRLSRLAAARARRGRSRAHSTRSGRRRRVGLRLGWHGSDRLHTPDGLRRSPIAGGEVETLTSTDRPDGRVWHRYPQVLPEDRGILLTVIAGNRPADTSVAVLDGATSEVRTLMSGGGCGRYAFTGHLVYGSEGALYAMPFDLDRLAIVGTPARVVDDVHQIPGYGLTFYSMSDTGTLSYLPSRAGFASRLSLSWVDRTGRSSPLPLPRDGYDHPVLSPDGRAFAVSLRGEVVVIDLETGRRSQVTRGGVSSFALWPSGGESLVYGKQLPAAGFDIYRRRVVGGEAAECWQAGARGVPTSIYADKLLYTRLATPVDSTSTRSTSMTPPQRPRLSSRPRRTRPTASSRRTAGGWPTRCGRKVSPRSGSSPIRPMAGAGRSRAITAASPPSGRPPSARSSTSRMAGE